MIFNTIPIMPSIEEMVGSAASDPHENNDKITITIKMESIFILSVNSKLTRLVIQNNYPSSKLVIPKIRHIGISGNSPVYMRAVSKQGVMWCRVTSSVAAGFTPGMSR